jgi:hypothetical protein
LWRLDVNQTRTDSELRSQLPDPKVSHMGNQYRHGDVLIEQVDALPNQREKVQHTTLAHGEVTGHSHRIQEVADADLYQTSRGLFLHVRGMSVTVVHQEHDSITLLSGFYRVWRQREYSPEEIRVVRD